MQHRVRVKGASAFSGRALGHAWAFAALKKNGCAYAISLIVATLAFAGPAGACAACDQPVGAEASARYVKAIDPARGAGVVTGPAFNRVEVAPSGRLSAAGKALPFALVTLEGSGSVLGSSMADAAGHWSLEVNLGTHRGGAQIQLFARDARVRWPVPGQSIHIGEAESVSRVYTVDAPAKPSRRNASVLTRVRTEAAAFLPASISANLPIILAQAEKEAAPPQAADSLQQAEQAAPQSDAVVPPVKREAPKTPPEAATSVQPPASQSPKEAPPPAQAVEPAAPSAPKPAPVADKPAPAAEQKVAAPAQQPKPNSPPPSSEAGSVFSRIQDWLSRANRNYQNEVVKELSRPSPEKMAAEKAAAEKAAAEKVAAEKAAAEKTANEKKAVEAAAKKAEAQAKADAAKKAEEAKKAQAESAASKKSEEARKAEAEVAKKVQAEAEAAKKAEAQRKADETKRAAEAEAAKKAQAEAEAAKQADAQRKAEEAKHLAEAEAEKKAQAQKDAEAEKLRAAEQKRQAEQQRAEEERQREMERKAEADRQAAAAARPEAETTTGPHRRLTITIDPEPIARPSTPTRAGGRETAPRDDSGEEVLIARGNTRKIVFYPGGEYRRSGAIKRWLYRSRVCSGAGRKTFAPRRYVVARGDSLWRISSRHYKTGRLYGRIYRANRDRIGDPDLIYPCQRFLVPRRHRT